MKIAMFSPLPPKQTGIAQYAKNMLAATQSIIDFDLFDTGLLEDELLNTRIYDYSFNTKVLAKLDYYDLIVYHIGNSYHFHQSIYKTLLHKKGTVILHDAILYCLIAGQNDYEFIKDFCINYGFHRLSEIDEIKKTCTEEKLSTYSHPEKYPLLKTILNCAETIIVHSETARKIVLEQGYEKKIYVIPFLIYPEVLEHQKNLPDLTGIKAKFAIHDDDIIIGCFGFINNMKRYNSIFSALKEISKSLKFKFLIVGSDNNEKIKKIVNESGLQDRIIFTGYIPSHEDFFNLIQLSDIVINLRYPSMGETSAIVTQSMTLAKPCIVTNYGWFSELPDNTVYKIPYDEREIAALVEALLFLSGHQNHRVTLGENAKNYMLENYHPDCIAKRYHQIFSEIINAKKATV